MHFFLRWLLLSCLFVASSYVYSHELPSDDITQLRPFSHLVKQEVCLRETFLAKVAAAPLKVDGEISFLSPLLLVVTTFEICQLSSPFLKLPILSSKHHPPPY